MRPQQRGAGAGLHAAAGAPSTPGSAGVHDGTSTTRAPWSTGSREGGPTAAGAARPHRDSAQDRRAGALMTGALLVAGTTSDAGKSIVTTGLCRAFARRGIEGGAVQGAEHVQQLDGLRVPDGGRRDRPGAVDPGAGRAGRARGGDEPGAAQARQRPAQPRRRDGPAGREVSSRDFVDGRRHLARGGVRRLRRPVLALRPGGRRGGGQPGRDQPAGERLREHGAGPARRRCRPSWSATSTGAGCSPRSSARSRCSSPTTSGWSPGSWSTSSAATSRCSRPGSTRWQQLTGRPVYGVLPWHPDLWLDSEDALDLEGRRARSRRRRSRVAVVRLPRISNFTDVDALGLEPDLDVVFASDPRALADADLVVLPGHPRHHRRPGLAARARARPGGARARRAPGGRCSGSAAASRCSAARSRTPPASRAPPGPSVEGLGLLDVRTEFAPEKVLRLPTGAALGAAPRATRSTTAGSPGRRARSSSAAPGPARLRHDVARQPGGRRASARRSCWRGRLGGRRSRRRPG